MTELTPAARCCESHSSWTDLVQHLITSFPEITAGEVIDIVSRARRAEEEFGLPEAERIETAEVIARHQLLQLSGRDMPSPRLDPERHDRQRPATPEAV
jgi:hypothetical protein